MIHSAMGSFWADFTVLLPVLDLWKETYPSLIKTPTKANYGCTWNSKFCKEDFWYHQVYERENKYNAKKESASVCSPPSEKRTPTLIYNKISAKFCMWYIQHQRCYSFENLINGIRFRVTNKIIRYKLIYKHFSPHSKHLLDLSVLLDVLLKSMT